MAIFDNLDTDTDTIIIWKAILNNGYASPCFNNGWGVWQGDSLSSHLFVLAVEMLSVAVKENKNMQGIVVQKN